MGDALAQEVTPHEHQYQDAQIVDGPTRVGETLLICWCGKVKSG